MRGVRRLSPSMVVALVALVLAIGGSAIAAEGGFESSDGTIQGCIAQSNIVNRITDGLDTVTNGALTPVTQGVNNVVNGVDTASNGAVTAVTQTVTPKGTLVVVAPGTPCPTGFTAQSIAAHQVPSAGAASEVFAAHSSTEKHLGTTKAEVAATTVPAGDYVVDAVADVSERGSATVDQTIKCSLVDATGTTIPGTSASVTIPAGAAGARMTVPIIAVVHSLPPGNLGLDCKDSMSSTSGTSARIAATGPIPPAVCVGAGGQVQNGKCVGGARNGTPILTAGKPKATTTSSGSVQATPTPPQATPGCASRMVCFWDKPNFQGQKIVLPPQSFDGCAALPNGFKARSVVSGDLFGYGYQGLYSVPCAPGYSGPPEKPSARTVAAVTNDKHAVADISPAAVSYAD